MPSTSHKKAKPANVAESKAKSKIDSNPAKPPKSIESSADFRRDSHPARQSAEFKTESKIDSKLKSRSTPQTPKAAKTAKPYNQAESKADSKPLLHLPDELKKAKLPHFQTKHYACATYLQSESGVRQQVRFTTHALIIVLRGEKIMHTASGDYHIRAGEGLLLGEGSYCVSNITGLDSVYEALLLFFDTMSLFEFIRKNNFHKNAQMPQNAHNTSIFKLQKSALLHNITKTFLLYLEDFTKELLPFVSHKFDELFLFLSMHYREVFLSFVAQGLRRVGLELQFLYEETEFLNVAQMARLAHTDQASLCRHFKAAFGIAPKAWLDSKRFEKAAFLLAYTDKNVGEICAECGFSSPSWFSARFKSRYHRSPKLYRRQARHETL